MANTFIIKEEVLNEVANIMKPTESQFNSNVRYFLHQLIADPVHAEIPTCIKMANISRSRFIKMLIDRGIVNRTERLNDTDKDGNHKTPTMAVKYTIVNKVPDELEYKVSKTDFDRRVEKLRRSIFEKNLPQKKFNTPLGDQLAIAKNSPLTMGFIAPGEKKHDAASWLMNRAAEALNASLVLREGKEFNDEQKEIIKIVDKAISNHRENGSEHTKDMIRGGDYDIDEYGTFVLKLNGGLNGSGDWMDYFEALSDFCLELEHNGVHIWFIDGKNDCLDDVYDFNFGLKKKNDELNEEGGDGGATSADASGAFVQPLFKTMVRREINEMIEALSPNSELNNRYRNLGGGFEVHLEDSSVEQSIVTVQNKKSHTLYHICFDGVNFNIFRDANDGMPATHISYVFDELFNAFQQSGFTNMQGQKNGRVFKVTEEQMRLFKESTATPTVGGPKTEYQYTVPFPTDSNDETMKRHNGEGGSVSINHIQESNKESLHTSNVGDYINDNPIGIHPEDPTMKRGEGKHGSHGVERIEEGKKYVNMDVELRKGGRNAVKMSVDDFKNEMTHAHHEYAMEQGKEYKYDLQKTPTPSNFVYSLCYDNRDNEKSKIASMLHKDIWEGKYDFDSENVDAIGGIKMSKNGFPYIQCDAGGDWECPVCFFVYFDGNHFRAYVPLKGNALNRNDKHAFSGGGNENDAKFVQKELGISYDEANSMLGDISYNLDACLEDFLSRVEVKGTYKKRDYTNDEKKFDEYRNKKKEEREERDRQREEEQSVEYGEPDSNTATPLNEEQNKFLEKHGIKEVSCGLGYSEKEQKWYGWSHRAIHGFGIGDKGVECYPTGSKEGKIIKTMEQAKEAAKKFAESVS